MQTGYVTPNQFQQAWQASETLKCSIFEALEAVVGKPMTRYMKLHYHHREQLELKLLFGVECFDPAMRVVNFAWIHQCMQRVISLRFCDNYYLLPLHPDSDQPSQLWIGMVNPDHQGANQILSHLLRQYELTFQRMVLTTADYYDLLRQSLEVSTTPHTNALSEALMTKLDRVQKSGSAVDAMPPALVSPLDPQLDEQVPDFTALENITVDLPNNASAAVGMLSPPEIDLSEELRTAAANSVMTLVNSILYKALKLDVSDIHIEPQETSLQIRFRKDGILSVSWPPLPSAVIPAMISRFKILANLDIAERRIPQDGQIRLKLQEQKVVLRVNTLLTQYGEKIVLRVLKSSTENLVLSQLITDDNVLEQLRAMVRSPFGLILVTGPTGSGKSTTLYSAIAERNHPNVNICTVEDPIEYTLPGVNQVPVIRRKGIDFPQVLRALLRQDPDIILVGEIRDQETAKVAIEAALTGHLVLGTLHTNDATSTIVRLEELGIEPFRLANCLVGILAQRLVRQVCPVCRTEYVPDEDDARLLQPFHLDCPQCLIYQAKSLSEEEIRLANIQNNLCPHCRGQGYKGRVGVYELLRVDRHLKALISERANADQIRDAARQAGMKTLTDYSLQLVKEGKTTLEEVERVVFSSLVDVTLPEQTPIEPRIFS
jgi:type IV pilus assembly protein PilB